MLKLIKTTVLDASAASVTIDNIPQQFKSLKLVMSGRFAASTPYGRVTFNASAANYTYRRLLGDGAAASSATASPGYIQLAALGNFSTAAASTFSNITLEIPNYAFTTVQKAVSFDGVTEDNATTSYQGLVSGLWADTSAITSITVACYDGTTNFVAGSTFYLYGVA